MKQLIQAGLFATCATTMSLAQADALYQCVNSLVAMQGRTLYIRPGLPIKPMGDPKRRWSQIGLTPSCQALRASEAYVVIDANQVVTGLHIAFTKGNEKVLPLLDPAIQLAVSTQLARAENDAAMHPLSVFAGDQSMFHYNVKYANHVFTETLSWGQYVLGAQDEY